MPTVIEYESWQSYETDNEQEAIAEFQRQYGKGVRILRVVH